MKFAIPAAALCAGLLTGCAALPEEPPAPPTPIETGWWQGTWVIDTERLETPGPTARALAHGLAPTVRYELTEARLRQVVAGEITDRALTPTRVTADDAAFDLIDGRRLVLRREGEQATMVDGATERPLRRP